MKKIKKLDKKTEEIFKSSSVAVLLENLNNNIAVIGESQSALDKKFDGIEGRMEGLEGRMDSFETETGNNFKLVFDYLSRIEDELLDIKSRIDKLDKNKINKKEFNSLKMRVDRLERELEKYKARKSVVA